MNWFNAWCNAVEFAMLAPSALQVRGYIKSLPPRYVERINGLTGEVVERIPYQDDWLGERNKP